MFVKGPFRRPVLVNYVIKKNMLLGLPSTQCLDPPCLLVQCSGGSRISQVTPTPKVKTQAYYFGHFSQKTG